MFCDLAGHRPLVLPIFAPVCVCVNGMQPAFRQQDPCFTMFLHTECYDPAVFGIKDSRVSRHLPSTFTLRMAVAPSGTCPATKNDGAARFVESQLHRVTGGR